jgi:hypothetical protein
MFVRALDRRSPAMLLAIGVAVALAACGSKEPPAAPAAATSETAPATVPDATPAVAAAESTAPASWTPEALEELLAPVALYPDPVLSQVLIASTNPQELLDAGNWLIANETLKGNDLDEAAAKIGFTPPIRALIQFPQTVDMMCMEMGWTTELGEAFVADQPGVLDAVQRLRRQAVDVGNLKSSDAMKVETEVQEGKEVVVLKPPKPDVVYVPTYDPQAAYAPPPATVATTPSTMTPVEDKTKYDGGDMIMTGVLAFGAGILVSEIFDDDDDDYRRGYYYPNYGYGGMPYYPPYPYRPVYGGGYYPSHGYNRPNNWNNGGFQNNGNIVINTNGRPGQNGGYWDRYDNKRSGASGNGYRQPRNTSPITAAKQNRPELNELNKRQPRPMPADVKRPSDTATASNWKGQSSYAGKNKSPAGNRDAATRIAEAQPAYSRPAASSRPGDAQRPAPKVQGSYAGSDRSNRDLQAKRPDTRDAQRPAPNRDANRPKPSQGSDMARPAADRRDVQRPSGGDRGYGSADVQKASRDVQRPAPQQTRGANSGGGGGGGGQRQGATAVSGADRGGMDRAASQRGRQSLPQGAHSKGGGGGGGGKKKQGR